MLIRLAWLVLVCTHPTQRNTLCSVEVNGKCSCEENDDRPSRCYRLFRKEQCHCQLCTQLHNCLFQNILQPFFYLKESDV